MPNDPTKSPLPKGFDKFDTLMRKLVKVPPSELKKPAKPKPKKRK